MKSSPALPETLPLMMAPGVKSWTSSPLTSLFEIAGGVAERGRDGRVDFVVDVPEGIDEIVIDHKTCVATNARTARV